MTEEWRDIKGYEGLYQISNLGRVKVLEKRNVSWGINRKKTVPEHIKTINIAKNGYYMVDLFKEHYRKRVYVHRLVAEAFIPNPCNLPCINHKDENRSNNDISNLEWCTIAYNNNYGEHKIKMITTRLNNGTYKRSKYLEELSKKDG